MRLGYRDRSKIGAARDYTVVAMRVSRRTFVQTSMLSGAGATVLAQRGSGGNDVPASIASLKPLPNPAPPISQDERRARLSTAQIDVLGVSWNGYPS